MLNILKLYTTEGFDKYKFLLSSLNIAEPYFLSEYIDVFSGGLENLICFSYISDSKNVNIIMPGHLKPIIIGGNETDYFDFITPYGYTGPYISKNISDSDIEEFWKEVDEWYLQNNVVSEFIRFNLYGNERMYSGKITSTMLNVKGVIVEYEEQWQNFEHKVRKNVKRAQKENLSCRIFYKNDISTNEIQSFYDIYIHTMQRTNAHEKFFYKFDDFLSFIKNNPENSAICNIYSDEKIISSELVLVSYDSIFSFLGGTDENYFDKRPNDFLKFEMINWARNIGKKYYVLGGGYGYEDGIFKYKKSFFPNDIVKYYTGRKILNKRIYNELFVMNNNIRKEQGLDVLSIDDLSFFPIYNNKD